MKVTIECDEKEARLISLALDLYTRVGLGQFWYLSDCATVRKNLWADETNQLQDNFDKAALKLAETYTGHPGRGGYGIFHAKIGDDCKIAAHIHQQIRHEFFLQQKEEDKKISGVDAYPADIARIAHIPDPNFKIKIEKDETASGETVDTTVAK